jgi:hypothetical protein
MTDPVLAGTADSVHAGEASWPWPGHCVRAEVITGWLWVRLAHSGAPRYMVSLKISPHADEHDAVRALEWWLQSPGREDGDVIEVA